MTNNPNVLRCAKQVYIHLGLRERIQLLSAKDTQPPEIVIFESLCALDPKRLDQVIRQFLQWTPPQGTKKTLKDLTARIQAAVIEFYTAFNGNSKDKSNTLSDEWTSNNSESDMFEDDFQLLDTDLALLDTHPELLDLDPALLDMDMDVDVDVDVDVDFLDADSNALEYSDLPTPPASHHLSLEKPETSSCLVTKRSNSGESTTHMKKQKVDQDTTKKTPVHLGDLTPSPTPPPSPFSRWNNLQQTSESNIICGYGTVKLGNISWVSRFEIARFLLHYHIAWSQLPFEALQKFIAAIKKEPRELYHTMMTWYNTKDGKEKWGNSSLMERCSDYVWTHLKKETKNRMLHFSVTILLTQDKPPEIRLRAPSVGASNRFFRKFGQDRFLEMKLSKMSHPSLVRSQKDFFLKPFLLMGRVFEFLFIKDDTIVLFATKGDSLKEISIRKVIDWHIPVVENWKMTLHKFASRMGLGYSNSIPTLVFEPSAIRYVDDIHSGRAGEEETCMTDGCGIISWAAMHKIMAIEGAEALPCAIQGRIGGAKGIWILPPVLDFNSGEWIEIRHSQNKFKTGIVQADMNTDPLHYTFDLVKRSICIYPASLNTQFIQCLSSGGVPAEVFVTLLQNYIRRLVSMITDNNDIRLLREWVVSEGGLMRARAELEDIEKGVWTGKNNQDVFEDWTVEEETQEPSTQRYNNDGKTNQYSEPPSRVHETLVRLFDAGFDLTNAYVAKKVTRVFRDTLFNLATKYKIEIEKSCTVTCIPDPTGQLKEGEIFLQLSSWRMQQSTGVRPSLILGDIIVTRNPCGLESDIQKVRAIDCEALHIYTDIVVFPTQGHQSLASLLGGGDYDGDIIFCCWNEAIVEPFRASPKSSLPEKAYTAFDHDKQAVRHLVSSCRDEHQQQSALKSEFISVSLPETMLGLYENWRTVLAENKSFKDENVIYLAHMCAKLVDASKQGLLLKPSVFQRDQKDFSSLVYPRWFVDKRHKQREKNFALGENHSEKSSRKHIATTTMDHLYVTLLEETDIFANHLKNLALDDIVSRNDIDLSSPWNLHMDRAIKGGNTDLLNDMKAIKQQIDESYEVYRQHCRKHTHPRNKKHAPSVFEESQQFTTTFELEEYFASIFENVTSTQSNYLTLDSKVNGGRLLKTLKASYAYIRTIKDGKHSNYCYVVAFDCLRRIKADACTRKIKKNGLSESISPDLYIAMTIDRTWLKRLRALHVTENSISGK
ncbi:RNA dependent RNA polymerase-domain-containing protein [Spinellus fusiger]|nr:RNA dependent RNA polymerase-domain-containing protein [Spinellus fusiger]